MNPEDFKKCNKCLIYKTIDQYHAKQYECKTCKLTKDKTKYNQTKIINLQEKIKERTPYRNEFLKFYLENGGTDIKEFSKIFIPFEKYDEMKKQPTLYSFCECDTIRKHDREHNKMEYDKKYWLDVMMCMDNSKSFANMIHII
jgi:hypothetical protein